MIHFLVIPYDSLLFSDNLNYISKGMCLFLDPRLTLIGVGQPF